MRTAALLLAVLTICTGATVFALHSRAKSRSDAQASLAGVFDGAYMIGLRHCKARWASAATWATRVNLSLIRVHATGFDDMTLIHPPIPVLNIPAGKSATAGQVGCTASHIRVWRDAWARNMSHVLVLEDDVRLTDTLIARLPALLHAADAGAASRRTPWHFMYLRAYATRSIFPPPLPWHASDIRLTPAEPSWGTAAYVLSAAGVRMLLTRITAYSRPIDVPCARLQRKHDTQGAPFVALSACAFRFGGPHGCPENVRELTRREKGNCFFSASQAGGFKHAAHWPRV